MRHLAPIQIPEIQRQVPELPNQLNPAKANPAFANQVSVGFLSRAATLHAWVTAAIVFLGIGLCYAAGAELAWGIFGASTIGLAFFPPAGLTLASMVLLPRRFWPVVIAAIFVAEIAVDLRHGLTLATAMGWALANSVEPLVGASLLRRFQRSPLAMSHRRGMFRFLLAGVIGGPLAGSVVVGAMRAANSNSSWLFGAVHFWAGDGLGVLAIAAPILVCWEIRPWRANRLLLEAVAAELGVLIVSVLAFWVWSAPPTFLVLPVLVVVGIRYATPGVTVASAVMGVVANISAARGHGPFLQYDTSPQNQLTFVQLFIASVTITSWYLAIETADRASSSAAQKLDQAARERAEATKAIGDLSENLLSPVDLREIAAVMRAQVGARFDLSLCSITLVNQKTGKFEPMNTGIPSRVVEAISQWTVHTDLPGPIAVATGQAVWVDSQTDLLDRFPALSDLVRLENLHTLGALPLQGSDRLLGYLGVARNEDRPFTSVEQADLLAVALVTSQAVQRAEIYETERQTRRDLEIAKAKVDGLLLQSTIEGKRLRESENRFRAMSDGSPLLIWVTNADGAFEWANVAFCECLALTVEQLVRGEFQNLFHPDDLGPFRELYQAALTTRDPYTGEWRVWATGQWRRFKMWAKPRFDPAGVFCGYIGNSIDVTDQRLGEERLRSVATLQQLGLRLADAFAEATDNLEIQTAATVTLNKYFEASRVRWVELDANDELALAAITARENPQTSIDPFLACNLPLVDEHDSGVVQILRKGRIFSVTDVPSDDRLTSRSKAIAGELGVVAYVIQPIRINQYVTAVLVVEHTHPHQWTDLELVAIKEAAKRTGSALEAQGLAIMTANLRQAEREAVFALQHALLPNSIRWNPCAVVYALYQAASNLIEVGGDWYDTFAWPTGQLGLMVGDVVGHNIASAAEMGRLRAAASALAGESLPNPAVILEALNRFARGPDGTNFATAACVIIDPSIGRLSYASAGHPPAIVVASNGTVTRLSHPQSAPLGVALSLSSGAEAFVDLEPGSLVVLYSDGLIERRGEPLDVSITRLENLLAANRHMPISVLTDFVVASLTANAPPTDDIVIACFRYTPAVRQLDLHFDACADQLAGMRKAVRIWLDTGEIASEIHDDVLLVVDEACANSIDHAYRNRPIGAIHVEIFDHTHHLVVRVTDQGTWRPTLEQNENRGRGKMIMQALTDRFEIQHDKNGTVMSCTITLNSWPR